MEFEPAQHPPRLTRRKGLIERAGRMRRQIVEHDPDALGLGEVNVGDFTHAGGEVHCCPAVGDFDLAPGPMHIEEDKQVRRAIALILAVVAFELARFGRDRLADLADELGRALVETDYRALRIGRFGVQVEHILMAAVEKRLREELADLQVEINEEKSRIVDLSRGGSFGFLGFDFRRIRSHRGAWRANYTPQLKRRTALQRKLKDVFRRHQSQPVDRVVLLINPILRGWVNYFAVGHSSECFSFIKDWVEKKVRRHMLRARKRKGFGWTRWSRQWLYETLRLFNGYRICRPLPKVAPAG